MFAREEVYGLGILMCLRCFRKSFHACHSLSLIFGGGFSHSQVHLVSAINRALPWMLSGTTNARGSKRMLMVCKTPLWVLSFTVSDTKNVNISLAVSQLTPKPLCIGGNSVLKFGSFSPPARSLLGNAIITLGLLEAILCSLKLEAASSS